MPSPNGRRRGREEILVCNDSFSRSACLRRQVAIHERDHSVEGGIEWILTQFRQIDERGAGFEQSLYPESLLDDVIVRGKHRQWRFQTLEFFLDGVTASGAKRGTGVCREHMLYKSAMHVGQIVRRLAKGEPAAPGTQYMAALGCRPQRLLAVLFQLTLLFFGRKQRHSDDDDSSYMGTELMSNLDGLQGARVYAQYIASPWTSAALSVSTVL